ncbi:MAG: type II toxin-antitoxin system VapC family toxin [Akkermansiaceae bacterium]|nr:type II toxin-antitoxin system VapC family toxin [Akkermansiaceae bacterium]
MTVVLDTNAYSEWVRDGLWAEEIETATLLVIPAPVLGELRDGFLKGTRAAMNEKVLSALLESTMVAVASIGESTTHHYARFKNELRKMGKPIPTNDIWIAAIAHEVGGILLTSDAHFKYLPQVKTKLR